jgi:hypothetical protein
VNFVSDRTTRVFRLMLERRQLADALPDLNVIPINKPHCKLDCGVVIDAVKVGSACEMAVLTDEVNPV